MSEHELGCRIVKDNAGNMNLQERQETACYFKQRNNDNKRLSTNKHFWGHRLVILPDDWRLGVDAAPIRILVSTTSQEGGGASEGDRYDRNTRRLRRSWLFSSLNSVRRNFFCRLNWNNEKEKKGFLWVWRKKWKTKIIITATRSLKLKHYDKMKDKHRGSDVFVWPEKQKQLNICANIFSCS